MLKCKLITTAKVNGSFSCPRDRYLPELLDKNMHVHMKRACSYIWVFVGRALQVQLQRSK